VTCWPFLATTMIPRCPLKPRQRPPHAARHRSWKREDKGRCKEDLLLKEAQTKLALPARMLQLHRDGRHCSFPWLQDLRDRRYLLSL